MSVEHVKNEKVPSGGKPEPSGSKPKDKVPSGDIKSFDDKHKHKERKKESAGSTKSHKKNKDHKKNKKMKKVVYYETNSSLPSTLGDKSTSSKRQHKRVTKFHFAILAFQNALNCFRFH